MLFRASLIIAFATVAACGPLPEEMTAGMPGPVLQSDAGAPAGTGGAMGQVDALPPVQATGGATAGTGGQGGGSAPDAMPAATGGRTGSDAGAPKADAMPTKYLGCFEPDGLSGETMCSRPNPKVASGFDFQRKDGYRCALCKWKNMNTVKLNSGGCLLAVVVNPQFQGDNTDPTPVLCVMSCGECAY